MQESIRFIHENFKQIAVLKESGGNLTELVMNQDNTIFVRKTIPYTGVPYQKLIQLSHPLLPKIFYVAEDDGKTYVVEQHIDGQNLQGLLEHKGSLPESQVRNIALQLCEGLEYLHKNQIIHRDIKPSNIIIQENGIVRLIDFGAARIADGNKPANQDTRILGTPGYAPPEQYGFSVTDYRSDYYALGMTLQTLLGNQYKGSLTKVIHRCVELDPERRIQTADELRSLLQTHWYDVFINNKNVAALFLCILLGGAAWHLATPNKTEIEKMTLPPTNATTQETKQQTAATQNEKDKLETKTGSDEENPPQIINSKNKLRQSKEILSKTIIETNPTTTEASKPINVQFNGSNWNNFQKTEQNLGPKVPNADKVVHPAGQWPQVMLTNNSDAELKNPRVDLYFTDFGVLGNDFSADAWGGRKETITYSGKTASGLATKITLRLDGTLPPNDDRPLSLFGGVSGFYRTGANPSVRMVFSADNAPAQEKSVTIGVK